MGDIADELIDRMIDGWFDHDHYEDNAPSITCKFCGERGLMWLMKGEWILWKPLGGRHNCRAQTSSIERFYRG